MKRFFVACLLLGLLALGVLFIIRFYTYETITPIRGEFVSVEGHSIYITDHGEGVPVIFLPGYLVHSDTFFNIVKDPPKGFRYITIDWPGMGFSKKADDKSLTPADMALILKLFLDKAGISKAVLVGHDLGGGVGMIAAARYPNLIKGLVLIAPDSSHGNAGTFLGPWWSWPFVRVVWAAFRLDRYFVRQYIKDCWPAGSEGWTKYVERYYQPLMFQNARVNLLSYHKQRRHFHYLPYEERIEMPVLVIWGDKDRIVPISAGHELARTLPSAEMKTIKNTGHLPQDEAAEKVGQMILDYLRTVDFDSKEEK